MYTHWRDVDFTVVSIPTVIRCSLDSESRGSGPIRLSLPMRHMRKGVPFLLYVVRVRFFLPYLCCCLLLFQLFLSVVCRPHHCSCHTVLASLTHKPNRPTTTTRQQYNNKQQEQEEDKGELDKFSENCVWTWDNVEKKRLSAKTCRGRNGCTILFPIQHRPYLLPSIFLLLCVRVVCFVVVVSFVCCI